MRNESGVLDRSTFLRVLGAFGFVSAGPTQAALAQARTVYLATYSHVDPDWLWPYQEGEQQAHSTFRSVLGILDEFPQLRFSMTSAVHYKWVRESDPALFERIRAAVARRQWEPLVGWWVEADTNVPSGESLMRQAVVGQAEFEAAFGVRSTIAFLPDSFGSSANLPEILRAQGMTGYVLKRGEFDDGSTPPPVRFTWQGLGSATIPAYKLPLWNGSNDVPAKLAELAAMNVAGDSPLVVFGLGDHGGGPSRAAMRSIETYRQTAGAVPLEMTRIDDFFARATSAPQHFRGELEGDLVGSYVNAGNYKRALASAERALIDVERYDVMWHLASGSTAPPPDLTLAWQTLLARCHHDTVSGTAAQQSMRAAREDLDGVALAARRSATRVLEKIVDRIPHLEPSAYVVAVFNPLEREVEVPVVQTVGAGAFSHDADSTLRDVPTAAFDANGGSLPLQIAQADDGLSPVRSIRSYRAYAFPHSAMRRCIIVRFAAWPSRARRPRSPANYATTRSRCSSLRKRVSPHRFATRAETSSCANRANSPSTSITRIRGAVTACRSVRKTSRGRRSSSRCGRWNAARCATCCGCGLRTGARVCDRIGR